MVTTHSATTVPVKLDIDGVDNGTVTATFAAGDSAGTLSVDLTSIAVDKVMTLTLDSSVVGWDTNYTVGSSNNSTTFTTVVSADTVVEFGYDKLTVDEDEIGNLSLVLDRKELNLISVPVNVATYDASANTTTNTTASVTFTQGSQLANLAYDTTGFANGDTITYTFGTMPTGYVVGAETTAVLTVLSAANVVSFATATTANKFTNEDTTITVNLATQAVSGFAVVLNIQKTEGSVVTNTSLPVSFSTGDSNTSFTYNTGNDGKGTDSAIVFSFKSIPSFLTQGTQNTHSLTVKDSSVNFVGVPSRDETLEFNDTGTFNVVLATLRTTPTTIALQVTNIDANGTATQTTENVIIPTTGTKSVTYNATALTDAGKQRTYRLPSGAATIAPSANPNFDYRFNVSSKLFWIETANTDTIFGDNTVITFRTLEATNSNSKFIYLDGTIAREVTIAAGQTSGTSIVPTSLLNVGTVRNITIGSGLSPAIQNNYHADPTRNSSAITIIPTPNSTMKFLTEYSVADPGDTVTLQWQATPAYTPATPADNVSLKRTYIGSGGNVISTVSDDITDYSAPADVDVTVPGILDGDDVVVELDNLPTGYGAVEHKKHTIYTPRKVSFDSTIYTGTVGTQKTDMKLRASNALPYSVTVPVTAVVRDSLNSVISTETFNVTFGTNSSEAVFSYDMPNHNLHTVSFSLPATFSDPIIKLDNSNLTAILRATDKIPDVGFTAVTSTDTYSSLNAAGRTLKIPVTLGDGSVLNDNAAVAIALQVREAFGGAGTWQNASAKLKKDTDGTPYVEYAISSGITGDGLLGVRLIANDRIDIDASNDETNISLTDNAPPAVSTVATFTAITDTHYDIFPFTVTFTNAVPYDVAIPFDIHAGQVTIGGVAYNNASIASTVTMPANTTQKTFYHHPLPGYALRTNPRSVFILATAAFDGMTFSVGGSFITDQVFNAYEMDMRNDRTLTASPADTLQVRLDSLTNVIERKDILPPEITWHVSTQIDGGAWSAYQPVTQRVALRNPSAWVADTRNSTSILVPYTVPQFTSTMKAKFKLEFLPGLFIPQGNDNEVIYTITKPLTTRTLSFNTQDLGSDKEFDEDVDIVLSVTPVSTSADITVPITITYTPKNSITPSKTVPASITIAANTLSGTLTHKTLKYHNHTVRFEADISGLSGVTMNATKNYSQYIALANEVSFKLASGSGSYASDSQLTVQAKTLAASYSDMIVKSRYRTKFGTSPFGAWQETTATISKGNTQNGFNLSYNLPTFTQNGTIEIELLDNDAGNVSRSDGATDIHTYTGTITHVAVTREISFDNTPLPDVLAGQTYTVPMVVSQSFSTAKDIPIKIEYIDRTSNAVLETDNTQVVTFAANSTSADFTQTAPTDKHNVWVKITAVPVANSNITVNSLLASATMKLDGYLFAFDDDNPSGIHSGGDTISFTLNSSSTITQAVYLPVEFRRVNSSGGMSSWILAEGENSLYYTEDEVFAYGNTTVMEYISSTGFTNGTYRIQARVQVGPSTGIYDANDPSNTGYIQSDYTLFHPSSTPQVLEFNFATAAGGLPGGSSFIFLKYACSCAVGYNVDMPFTIEYRDTDNGNKLMYTDTFYHQLPGNLSSFNFSFTRPYHHNYEVTVTANPPSGSPITVSASKPSTKFPIVGYEMALDAASSAVNRAPGFTVSVSGTLHNTIPDITQVQYRLRKRIYGEAWQAWEYATFTPVQFSNTFTLSTTTPSEDYTYADIEFELIDNSATGFYVDLGNSKHTVSVTNNTVPASTYSFSSTTSTSTTYYTGKVVNYNLAFTSAVNKDMLIPLKAVISDRTTSVVTAIDRFTVAHTSGDTSHALSYKLPDGDNKYVTISLDLPSNNSLFTAANASLDDVRYSLNGYELKFNSADVVTSTVVPGNSIAIEVARQSGASITYNNVTAIMQRRTQIDDGTWSNWFDFAVALGTSQNTTFNYVIPHFNSLFNMQVRLKPGGDSGVEWDSGSVTTYNYNAISQTVQTGTIRMIGNDLADPTTARPGEDVGITIELYNESDSAVQTALADITVPIRATITGKASDTLLVTIPAGSSTGNVIYPAPLNDNGAVTVELITNDDADAPLQSSTTPGFESTTFIVRAYDMSFAGVKGAVDVTLTKPGEMVSTTIHPHYSGQEAVADIDLTLIRRFKADGGDWGLWETITVTMPEGTKPNLDNPAGFDYIWEVPVYNTTLEVELQLVETPEQGIVIAFAKKELAKYEFHKQYRVEYVNPQSNAFYTQESFPDAGGTVNVPIKIYGPPVSSAVTFKTVFLRQSRNRNRSLSNTVWERGEIDVTIPANTVSGSTINVPVAIRARSGTGSYRYILYLDSKLVGTNRVDVEDNDTVAIDDDIRRTIDIYFALQISHRWNQTTEPYADAHYTMSLQDYNKVSGGSGRTSTGKLNGTPQSNSYKTDFYLPILVGQKTLAPTYLKYKIRSRTLNVDGTTASWGSWSATLQKVIPIITNINSLNGDTAYLEFTLAGRPSSDDHYGIEYEVAFQSGSNYSLKEPTDLSRIYTVNQYPLLQHNVSVKHLDLNAVYALGGGNGGNGTNFSSYNACVLTSTTLTSKFDVPIKMLNGSSTVDSAPNVKARRHSQEYYRTTFSQLYNAVPSTPSNATITGMQQGAAPGTNIVAAASVGATQQLQSPPVSNSYGRRVTYSLVPSNGSRVQQVVVSNTTLAYGRVEADVFCKY